MAASTTLTAILVCLILVSMADASGPVLTSFPDQINLGLTDTLDVNCTLSLVDWPGVAALISLTVSRNKSSTTGQSELAIISDYSSEEVISLATENVLATGYFTSSDSASINLHWGYPTDHQEGIYGCRAVGFDSVGRIVVEVTYAQVSAHSPALEDWQNKVVQMDKRVKMLEAMLEKQDEDTRQCQSDTKELQTSVTEVTNETLNAFSQAFEASFEYGNHTYGLSRDAFWDIHLSLAVCRIYGGYLAEIDDSDEHSAINTFLQSVTSSAFGSVYIGGSDEEKEGTWILPSGKPLSFTVWDIQEPDNLDYQDCLFMKRGNGLMVDYQCSRHADSKLAFQRSVRFLCEVPNS